MTNSNRYQLAAGLLITAILASACGPQTPDAYAGNFACTTPPAAEGQHGETIAKVQTATVRAYLRSAASTRIAAVAEQTCGINQYTTGIMVRVDDAPTAPAAGEGIGR